MALLNNMKLVSANRKSQVDPVMQRRNKLCSKLQEQLELCEAKKSGQNYVAKKLRTYIDKETGQRSTVEVARKVREWFWQDNGKINLAIKYGSQTLVLNKKGATAIEVASGNELISTLQALKVAALEGEFDEAIEAVSLATREGFGK